MVKEEIRRLDEKIDYFYDRCWHSVREGCKVFGKNNDMAKKRFVLAYGYSILLEDIKKMDICYSFLEKMGFEDREIGK